MLKSNFAELNDGDVCVQKNLTKSTRIENNEYTCSFDPPKGEHFITLLVGAIPGTEMPSEEKIIEMMDAIGWTRKKKDN